MSSMVEVYTVHVKGHSWPRGRGPWVGQVFGSRNVFFPQSVCQQMFIELLLQSPCPHGTYIWICFRKWIPIFFCTTVPYRSTISLEGRLFLSLSQEPGCCLWNSSPVIWSASQIPSVHTCLSSRYWPVVGTSDSVLCPLCLSVLTCKPRVTIVFPSKEEYGD